MSNLILPFPQAATGPVIQGLGDSITEHCGVFVSPPATGSSGFLSAQFPGRSQIAWACRLLGQRVRFDMSKGYGGTGALFRIDVTSGGSGYSAGTTVAVSASGWTCTTQPTLTIVNGVITAVTVSDHGSASYNPPFTVTVSDPNNTGSGAVLTPISGAHGTFGVAGQTSAQILARVGDVISAGGIDMCAVMAGTNDSGTNPAATIGNVVATVEALMAARIRPYLFTLPMRGASGGLTAAQYRAQLHINEYLRQYTRKHFNPNGTTGAVLVDFAQATTDCTSANGYPLAGVMGADTLHPALYGAILGGQLLAAAIKQTTPVIFPARSCSQIDVYDATNNPTGNLLAVSGVNMGSMLGTGGTVGSYTGGGSATVSGTVCNGFAVQGSGAANAAGSVTCTAGYAVAAGTMGYPNATSQRLVVALTAGGGTETVQMFGKSAVTLSTAGIAAGTDQVALLCDIVLSGGSNLVAAELQLRDTATNGYRWYDGAFTSSSDKMPASLSWTARTPWTVTPSSTTALTFFLTFYFNASGGSAGATIDVLNFELKKLAA